MVGPVMTAPSARLSQAFGAATVAVGFLALFPPQALEGRFSTLEAALLLLTAAIVLVRMAGSRYAWTVPLPVVLLLLLMGSSVVWGTASWTTLRDAFAYAVLAAVASMVVMAAGLRAIVTGVAIGGMVILVSSAVLLAVNPSAALFFQTDAVQGVFTNRNTFGYAMLQTLPAVLALPTTRPLPAFLKIAAVGAVLVAIALSQSQTSIVGSAVVLVVWVLALLVRRWRPMRIIAPVALLLGGVVVLANARTLLDLLGKDASLTGRAPVWDALLALLPHSPVVGFGWSQSWPEGSPHSVAVAEAINGVVLYHAHNELLNWAITLGLLGLIVILAVYGQALAGAMLLARRPDAAERLWPLLALAALLARGLTEISETNPQGWFVLMLAIFATVPALNEKAPIWLRRLLFLTANRPVDEATASAMRG